MDKKKYEKTKALIKNLEDKNYSNLIIFRSGAEWYKMGGNSLLIYFFKIAPELGIKPNIQADTDYTKIIFAEGVISFRGVKALEEKLKRLKVINSKKENADYTIFELNFRVDPAQTNFYREELTDEREKLLKTIAPKITVKPILYSKLRHLQKRIFEIVRKMTEYERKYNGYLLADYSRKLTKYYLMANVELMAEEDCWSKINELIIELLKIEFLFVLELKIINQNTAANIFEEIVKIKKMVDDECRVAKIKN